MGRMQNVPDTMTKRSREQRTHKSDAMAGVRRQQKLEGKKIEWPFVDTQMAFSLK